MLDYRVRMMTRLNKKLNSFIVDVVVDVSVDVLAIYLQTILLIGPLSASFRLKPSS